MNFTLLCPLEDPFASLVTGTTKMNPDDPHGLTVMPDGSEGGMKTLLCSDRDECDNWMCPMHGGVVLHSARLPNPPPDIELNTWDQEPGDPEYEDDDEEEEEDFLENPYAETIDTDYSISDHDPIDPVSNPYDSIGEQVFDGALGVLGEHMTEAAKRLTTKLVSDTEKAVGEHMEKLFNPAGKPKPKPNPGQVVSDDEFPEFLD